MRQLDILDDPQRLGGSSSYDAVNSNNAQSTAGAPAGGVNAQTPSPAATVPLNPGSAPSTTAQQAAEALNHVSQQFAAGQQPPPPAVVTPPPSPSPPIDPIPPPVRLAGSSPSFTPNFMADAMSRFSMGTGGVFLQSPNGGFPGAGGPYTGGGELRAAEGQYASRVETILNNASRDSYINQYAASGGTNTNALGMAAAFIANNSGEDLTKVRNELQQFLDRLPPGAQYLGGATWGVSLPDAADGTSRSESITFSPSHSFAAYFTVLGGEDAWVIGSERIDPYGNVTPYTPPDPTATAGGAGAGGGFGVETRAELLDALAQAGVKHTPSDIVRIARTQDGKIVFLERGKSGEDGSGLQHIIEEHVADFAERGIPEEQIPDAVMAAATRGRIIGYQGLGRTPRPVYEFTFNGQTQYLSITVGSNGYIVGANPTKQAVIDRLLKGGKE